MILLMYIINTKKKISNDFKIKKLGEYHDLYVQSDTLLLADVFNNFLNKCLKIYELDLASILSEPELAWQATSDQSKTKPFNSHQYIINGRKKWNQR